MPIHQCFVFGNFRTDGVSTRDLLGAAKQIGYEGVELWTRDESELAIAKDHGLQLVTLGGHKTLEDGLNKPANHDRIEAELRDSIAFAKRNGIRSLICFSGNRNKGQSDYEGAVATAQGLRRVAKAAEDAGVTLVLELLNSKVDHYDYQCDRTDWGVAVCEMVQSPAVKLLYDCYHMQIMEGHIITHIRRNIGWIGHFHTAGNPGRRDFDDTQEMHYRGICAAIAATGYEGYVGHEFSAKGDRVEALRTAFEVCNVP